MDIVERLTPDTDIKATLEGLLMPILATVLYTIFFIIINLWDGDDDVYILAYFGQVIPFVGDSTAFLLTIILLSFWIGIVAVNSGGNIGDALVGSAIVGFVFSLLNAIFLEVFLDGDLYNDNFLDGDLWLYTFYLTFLFIMFGVIGAGFADDMFGESEPKTAKKAPTKKAPAKKAPAKKKTTKKATKTADE